MILFEFVVFVLKWDAASYLYACCLTVCCWTADIAGLYVRREDLLSTLIYFNSISNCMLGNGYQNLDSILKVGHRIFLMFVFIFLYHQIKQSTSTLSGLHIVSLFYLSQHVISAPLRVTVRVDSLRRRDSTERLF